MKEPTGWWPVGRSAGFTRLFVSDVGSTLYVCVYVCLCVCVREAALDRVEEGNQSREREMKSGWTKLCGSDRDSLVGGEGGEKRG